MKHENCIKDLGYSREGNGGHKNLLPAHSIAQIISAATSISVKDNLGGNGEQEGKVSMTSDIDRSASVYTATFRRDGIIVEWERRKNLILPAK